MLIVTPTRRGYMPSERSGRPELLPAVHGVYSTSNSGNRRRVRERARRESVVAARLVGSRLDFVTGVERKTVMSQQS
jgi:hypothetical protein